MNVYPSPTRARDAGAGSSERPGSSGRLAYPERPGSSDGLAPPETPQSSESASLAGDVSGGQTLTIRPWHDPVIDARGFDARSEYVEEFWLGILGPSTTFLLRRLARGFDTQPDGYRLDVAETAESLGLGHRGNRDGKHSSFDRAVERCVVFDMARHHPDGALAVRRRMPPLAARHLRRLSAPRAAMHDSWLAQHERPIRSFAAVRERARQLALSLVGTGEDARNIEIQLLRWGVHPSLTRESATWALARQPMDAGPRADSSAGAGGHTP